MFGFPRKPHRRRSSKAERQHRRLLRPRFEKLEDRSLLSIIAVTTFEDVVDSGDGLTSLREAITQANANPGLDTIQLKSGTYKIGIPGPNEDLNATGDFDITDSLKIVGGRCTTIDGRGLDRVFDIPSRYPQDSAPADTVVPTDGIEVTFKKVKITGGIAGQVTPDGGGVHAGITGVSLCFVKSTVCGNSASGRGGGVYSAFGDISLQDSHVDNNTAGANGGGIFLGGAVALTAQVQSGGEISIVCSTVNGNSAGGSGGGVQSNSNGSFTLTDSKICSNHSVGDGGGANLASESVTISDSCVSNNTSGGNGGGLNTFYSDLGTADSISIEKSTFCRNQASGDGGAIFAGQQAVHVLDSRFQCNVAGGNGGGIKVPSGTIDVTGSKFLNNRATYDGGGFHAANMAIVSDLQDSDGASGDVSVVDSLFEGNVAANGGGFSVEVETVTVTDSTFQCNTATDSGGGLIVAAHTLTMTGSTVSDNRAGNAGGGIFIRTTGTILKGESQGDPQDTGSSIVNSTISGNSAAYGGGGIDFEGSGDLNITYATIAFNISLEGGGIRLGGGSTHIQNTIVAKNTATTGPDVHQAGGALDDLAHNLIFADPQDLFTDPTDIIGQDPLLGLLALNGGKTKTHALLKSSPAIGAAAPVAGITTDQRGVARDATAPCIGAYEYVNQSCKKSKSRESGHCQHQAVHQCCHWNARGISCAAQGDRTQSRRGRRSCSA